MAKEGPKQRMYLLCADPQPVIGCPDQLHCRRHQASRTTPFKFRMSLSECKTHSQRTAWIEPIAVLLEYCCDCGTAAT